MTSRHTAIHLFFRAVDARDWDAVTATLADRVSLDYTSLFGGDPETLPAGEVTVRWRGLLPGFDATMHFLGPLVEDSDTVQCNVRGYHHLDGETWMVAGWYTLDVTDAGGQVRIRGITLETAYEDGSRELVDRAHRRASA